MQCTLICEILSKRDSNLIYFKDIKIATVILLNRNMVKNSNSHRLDLIFILGTVGGVLIILDGVANLFTVMQMQSYAMLFPFLSIYSIHQFLGLFGVVIGIVIILLNISAVWRPKLINNTFFPVVIISLAAVTIVSGGGFVIGFLLVLIEGLWCILLNVNADLTPMRRAVRAKYKAKETMHYVNTNGLSGQEKSLLSLIRKNRGAILQNRLVTESGLSRTKVTRILNGLEIKGVIERRRMGMTNLIISK